MIETEIFVALGLIRFMLLASLTVQGQERINRKPFLIVKVSFSVVRLCNENMLKLGVQKCLGNVQIGLC